MTSRTKEAGGLAGAVELEELVGREAEQEELRGALQATADGRGGLLLVGGEAGVGKTRVVEHVLRGGDLAYLGAAASQEGTPPYGQIVSVFRAYLRLVPDGLADCGPLGAYLALLLPELGAVPDSADRAALFEAIHCAFATIGRRGPTCVFLDDLNWADYATLDLLPALAASLEAEPVLIVAAYRSDEIPRGHPLRRLRAELRRGGRLRELAVEPLDAEQTSALAARVVGGTLGDGLRTALYLRTQGVPFFIEELAGALAAGGNLVEGGQGLELVEDEDRRTPALLIGVEVRRLRLQRLHHRLERLPERPALDRLVSFLHRNADPQQRPHRRTTAAEYLEPIDWDDPDQRRRLLTLIDEVLVNYPAEEEQDRGLGGRLRRSLGGSCEIN